MELELLALQVSERRFALVRDACFLAVTVIVVLALTAVTVFCALRGAPWPIPTGTGTGAGLSLAAQLAHGLK